MELGPSLETQRHRGRQDHMDKPLLFSIALTNLTLSAKEVCDQEQHFFPLPRAPPEHTCQLSFVTATTEHCCPRWAEASDDANPLTAHGVGPATGSYLQHTGWALQHAQQANSNEGEKPCYRLM